MDWTKIIGEIRARGYTLAEVAAACGFASAGAVHDLQSGKQKTSDYERGARLIALHKRVSRRKALP